MTIAAAEIKVLTGGAQTEATGSTALPRHQLRSFACRDRLSARLRPHFVWAGIRAPACAKRARSENPRPHEAAAVLGDFGADVVKVEPPHVGDGYRSLSRIPPNPHVEGVNYPWQLDNRNKRSIAFNLKSPDARPVLESLVRWADVLVTNFPPGTREKLGLEYDALASLNPRLIYADVTGFGEEGPDAHLPGFDVTAYWARSGLMDLTRQRDVPPAMNAFGSGDHSTAVTLFAGIMTALARREKTGQGSRVTASLLAEGDWTAGMWLQAFSRLRTWSAFSGMVHPILRLRR